MTEVDVVQILPESSDSNDSAISHFPTLGENQITKTRCSVNDLRDPCIGERVAIGEI